MVFGFFEKNHSFCQPWLIHHEDIDIYFIYLNIDTYKYSQYNTITNNATLHLTRIKYTFIYKYIRLTRIKYTFNSY